MSINVNSSKLKRQLPTTNYNLRSHSSSNMHSGGDLAPPIGNGSNNNDALILQTMDEEEPSLKDIMSVLKVMHGKLNKLDIIEKIFSDYFCK